MVRPSMFARNLTRVRRPVSTSEGRTIADVARSVGRKS